MIREFPAPGEYVEVTLSTGEKDYAVWIGHGFMLCEKLTARSHGHCVGMATDPHWVSWESLETLRLAEEATKRVFTGDILAAGVDFIVNCPLGDE